MSTLPHGFRSRDRVRLRNLPAAYAHLEGRDGTVGLVYADGDLEVTIDGDDHPTICGYEQLAAILTDETSK